MVSETAGTSSESAEGEEEAADPNVGETATGLAKRGVE